MNLLLMNRSGSNCQKPVQDALGFHVVRGCEHGYGAGAATMTSSGQIGAARYAPQAMRRDLRLRFMRQASESDQRTRLACPYTTSLGNRWPEKLQLTVRLRAPFA